MLNTDNSYKINKNLLKILLGVSVFCINNCSYAASHITFPIDPSDFATTLDRTIVPGQTPSTSVFPYEIPKFGQHNASGYGNWQYGPGINIIKRLDIASNATGISANSTRLLRFFTITDVHINDPETPAQTIYFGFCGNVVDCSNAVGASSNPSSFSPVMTYTTQVLDATVQTINIMQQKDPFDFGMALGDAVNNSQYNELRWYINVIDGTGPISPHSGSQSGVDQFMPAGLDKRIDWYQVLGNHDHLWCGSAPINAYNNKLKNAYTSSAILKLGDLFTNINTAIPEDTHYMGSINGITREGNLNLTTVGPIIGHTGYNYTGWTGPATIQPDTNRHPLSKTEWMNEFFNTTSNPSGHGFTKGNIKNGVAYYSFEPKPGIKVIVLDDTMPDALNNNVVTYAYGYLDKTQYHWLVSELDKGQAEDKLMIIAAHVPINVVPVDADAAAWTSTSPVPQATVLATLHKYPNLILWISGHRHINAITVQKSPDPAHPELGFWEVETASLRDFPQEFRTFDIYRNSDNTVSIVAIDVDPAIKVGSEYPAELSRAYAVASDQIFLYSSWFWQQSPYYYYNTELVKKLSSQSSSTSSSSNFWVNALLGGVVGVVGAAGIWEATTQGSGAH